jgi:hypothetical protein
MNRNVTHPTEYARLVVAGKEVVNRNVMMACKRHLHDLTREDDLL